MTRSASESEDWGKEKGMHVLFLTNSYAGKNVHNCNRFRVQIAAYF